MRKPIIAANWKMYKTPEEAELFFRALEGRFSGEAGAQLIVCASPVLLPALLQARGRLPIAIGAQTMHAQTEGAFTGEVSPRQLRALGVDAVILGHSERRQLFGETDAAVGEKTRAAFAYDLLPIVCVGETDGERERGETAAVVERQVEAALGGLSGAQAARAVVAYEPIWAIGTGKTATADDAAAVCLAIRRKAASLFGGQAAESLRILYGGSVKPSNIGELLAKDDIDGALVGGASLDPASFYELAEAAHHA